MTPRRPTACYEFAGYRLEPFQHRLVRIADSVPVPLPPRVFDTLAYLVAHPGVLVEKSTLMSALWPRTVVEENNLDRNISLARRALGESPKEHRFIVTVPGRGYRFVAHVTQVPGPDVAPVRTIVVLPFVNLTGDPAREYFCDGMAEELIQTLTRVPGLQVAARTSSFSYKGRQVDIRQIARDLDADLLLEGSVKAAGTGLRLSAQLVDGRSGFQIGSHTAEMRLDNLHEVQVDLVRAVVGAINTATRAQLKFPDAIQPATRDRQAYDLYLQARSLLDRPTEQNLLGGLRLLQAAVERDPDFARAWAALADVRLTAVQFDYATEDPLSRAEAEAQRALALDPKLSEACAALAMIHAVRGQLLAAAERFDQALLAGPDPRVMALRITYVTQSAGHVHRSLDEGYRAYRVGSLQPFNPICIAMAHSLEGDDVQAAEYGEIAARLGLPASETPLADICAQVAIRSARYHEACKVICAALTPPMRAAGGEGVVKLFCAALESSSSRPEALVALSALDADLRAGDLGQVDLKRLMLWYTMLGAPERAHDVVSHAIDRFMQRGMIGSAWGMMWLPEMRPFRQHARFHALAQRLGFADYWQRFGPPDGHELREGALSCEAT